MQTRNQPFYIVYNNTFYAEGYPISLLTELLTLLNFSWVLTSRFIALNKRGPILNWRKSQAVVNTSVFPFTFNLFWRGEEMKFEFNLTYSGSRVGSIKKKKIDTFISAFYFFCFIYQIHDNLLRLSSYSWSNRIQCTFTFSRNRKERINPIFIWFKWQKKWWFKALINLTWSVSARINNFFSQ